MGAPWAHTQTEESAQQHTHADQKCVYNGERVAGAECAPRRKRRYLHLCLLVVFKQRLVLSNDALHFASMRSRGRHDRVVAPEA